MQKKFYKWILPLLFLMISLACNLGAERPTSPEQSIPISTEAAESFQNALEQTVDQVYSGDQVTITVTQEQATALVISELEKNQISLIKNPQVIFQNGKVEVSGHLTQMGLSANMRLVLRVEIGAENQPQVVLETIDLGSIPVSEGITAAISNFVDQTIKGPLTQYAAGYKIESLVISDGTLTITGQKQ